MPLSWDEEPILEHVKNCVANEKTNEINSDLMVGLLRKSYFKAGDYLMKNFFIKNSINIESKLQTELQDVKKKLESLADSVGSVKKPQLVLPVFKWGQSFDEIFLLVRYAHRFDSPICSNTKDHRFSVKENMLNFAVECDQGNNPIFYNLNILMNKDVDGSKASWKPESAGTAVLTIPKTNKGEIWLNLLGTKGWTKPSAMKLQVWWELKGAHKAAMEKYSELLEEDDDDNLWGDM